MADDLRPTKAETRDRLKAVEQATLLLHRELNNPAIRNLLQTAKSSKILISTWHLKDLSERADLAHSSSDLIAATGKTKPGRGTPKVPDLFDAKVLCAARVVELWLHFHRKEPGIGSKRAAAVAQAYWRASGGQSNGYGDPLNGWYDHFKTVRDNRETVGIKRLRLIWRRDLEQTAARGRPPWNLGTYFSQLEAEFKSPIAAA